VATLVGPVRIAREEEQEEADEMAIPLSPVVHGHFARKLIAAFKNQLNEECERHKDWI